MFFLFWWYHRASRPVRIAAWVLLLIVFVATILRVHKAVNAIQERNSHVHTRRNPR